MYDSDKMNDSDLARLLQEEYDREVAVSLEEEDAQFVKNSNSTSSTAFRNNQKYSRTDGQSNGALDTLTSGLSPVDPSLEFSDPTPDIRVLFLQFNNQFFWSSLSSIEVKWSPRMTMCAGLCVYEGRGGLCSVRLSLPLLKLRPRKDLVETLLHEMIHAYLFVTDNDKDHSGHGPNFLSHMKRINQATGANISVYHTFFDEVDSYLQHWWRCNGPCQQKAPYYGYVKRSMNRAPSARDLWWADHQASCGGEYTKIKEPEGYGQKKTGKEKGKDKPVDQVIDIRNFWGQGHILGSTSGNIKSDGKYFTEGKPSTNSNASFKAISETNRLSDTSKQVQSDKTLQKITDSTGHNISKVQPNTTDLEAHSKKFHQFFQNSSTNKKLNNIPHVINKKVIFPKNFVSVCEGADFSNPMIFKKKKKPKKYIIDELDSNDGLWEEGETDVRFLDSSGDSNNTEKKDAVTMSSHVDKPYKMSNVPLNIKGLSSGNTDVIKNESEKNIYHKTSKQMESLKSLDTSDKSKMEINSGILSVRNKADGFHTTLNAGTVPGPSSFNNHSLPSGSGLGKFLGRGNKLGDGDTGTSFLSQVRKTWQQRSNETSQDLSNSRHTKVSLINQTTVRSPVSDKKRKSMEAFGDHRSDNSDNNKVVRNDKGERSSAVAAIKISGNEQSNVPRVSVDERPREFNHDGRVPCPACAVMVPLDQINAHLDLCLISD